MKIESVSDNQFYTEVLEKSKINQMSLNLVLFGSSWCMPCKVLSKQTSLFNAVLISLCFDNEKVMLRNMKALSGSSLPMDRLSFYEIDTGILNLFLLYIYVTLLS